MGAGVQRWWRESSRLATDGADWERRQQSELARAIVAASGKKLSRLRPAAIALGELGRFLRGDHG